MRSGRPSHLQETERQRRERERREALWSRSQALYYRVFRLAVQFIRRHYVAGRDLDGRPLRAYGRLRTVLPPLSHLKQEHWDALRQQCGRA